MRIADSNTSFFKEHKYIKQPHIMLFMFLLNWICSNKLPHKTFEGRDYYYINYSYLCQQLNVKRCSLLKHIYRLKGDDRNKIPFIYTKLIVEKHNQNKVYFAINEEVALKSLNPKSRCNKKIFKFFKGENQMIEPLFEMDNSYPKYSIEAESIAKLILRKYSNYFTTRLPKANCEPTKSYLDLLHYITDIYNGDFTKSRLYPLSDSFINNKSFNIEGWRDKVLEVKGNWVKTKSLILNALKNFELMWKQEYMPYSKKYLQKSLSLWFYDRHINEPQSQFIQCLFEPEKISKHCSEIKADKIFESLPKLAQDGGNALFDLNPNIPAGTLWEGVKDIYEWAKELYKHDINARYWMGSPAELPLKFAKYLRDNELELSSSTLNLRMATDRYMPWVWFVESGANKHSFSKYVAGCSSVEELRKLYSRK